MLNIDLTTFEHFTLDFLVSPAGYLSVLAAGVFFLVGCALRVWGRV